jgi:hypothetical protein
MQRLTMTVTTYPLPHSLPRGKLLAIADASQVELQCLQGCLWITVDYDVRDIVLEPGDTFRADVKRRALVFALKPSELSVQPVRDHTAAPAKPSHTLWRHPAGRGSLA